MTIFTANPALRNWEKTSVWTTTMASKLIFISTRLRITVFSLLSASIATKWLYNFHLRVIDWMIESLLTPNVAKRNFPPVSLTDRCFKLEPEVISDLHIIGPTCMLIASNKNIYPLKWRWYQNIAHKTTHWKRLRRHKRTSSIKLGKDPYVNFPWLLKHCLKQVLDIKIRQIH